MMLCLIEQMLRIVQKCERMMCATNMANYFKMGSYVS